MEQTLLAPHTESALHPRYGLVSALLVWCGLAVVSSLYVTVSIGGLLAAHYGITLAQSAWASSAFSLFYALGFLACGPLSERYGRRSVILAGLALLAIISPLIGFAPSFAALAALRALQGAAASTFAPSALAYIMESYPAGKKVTAIGLVSTGFLTAGIVGQLFSSFIGERLGWPYVFHILGAVYLITALAALRLLPRDRAKGLPLALSQLPRKLVGVFLLRPLYACYAVTVTLLFAFVGMYLVLGHYLSAPPFGLTPPQLLLLRAAGIVGMAASPFAGALVARRGSYPVLLSGLTLALTGLLGLALIPSLPSLTVFSIVFVTGIALSVPTLIALIGQLAGPSRASAVSLYTFILFVGATLGPVGATLLMKEWGDRAAFLGLAGALSLGLLAALWLWRENRFRTTNGIN
ncbi:MFS transporter [Paenibacillus puerhi]|uniref:MFS transporter n=1 Tax=Paenibacillus puerhi TaxID=2692622 RepID=UPI00135A149D|nr:MFS transporter [Paenibacillus puerhi]